VAYTLPSVDVERWPTRSGEEARSNVNLTFSSAAIANMPSHSQAIDPRGGVGHRVEEVVLVAVDVLRYE